ncbi:TlpA family protein disulfide reductase [Mucilaginibacter sp. X4EP1]|uniref:TlpA family protein disulfide reductase n=1 Tax=Mucilaginibacter sp. X4EP1 TaxID=2723092 RepID=UPI002168FED8|nr:TlpA disulfide reductase family protein [Mucilaginibacter sp. X4EP1]MCS3815516.1 thiol-disulfide isomerase/thioredoxin [Mucilaginibacter sp. X4EP1]
MTTSISPEPKINSPITISMLVIFLLISIGVSAQQAIVAGTVPQGFSGKSITLTLINYETRNDKVVQEAKISGDGKFTLTINSKEPEIYDLGVDNSSLVQVLAKPGDKIDLKISKDHIEVTGSKETQYLVDYEANRKIVFNKYLRRTYDSSAAAVKSGDKARIEYWNVEHEKASVNYKAELAQWVEQPFFINSLAAVHHSIRWNSETDTALMNQMVAIYQQKYPNYDLTRQLVNKVNATKRIAIGAIAPGFVSTDTAGKKVDLKTYRGKYTFVEFWASWCPPCREESPTLVRLYNEYKDKGFTILSVSIDKNTTQWKNAIRQDGYVWGNVCDLNGYGGPTAALYTVTAIPNSFLLDKDGRIIAKNLRGKELESKLVELMK